MLNFKYTFTLYTDACPDEMSLCAVFPALSHIVLSSRKFQNLQLCMVSGKTLMKDILTELQDDEDNVYEMVVFSPETENIGLPDDWGDNELCRLSILKNPELLPDEYRAEAISAELRLLKCEADQVIIH